jgi:hypothetical protein
MLSTTPNFAACLCGVSRSRRQPRLNYFGIPHLSESRSIQSNPASRTPNEFRPLSSEVWYLMFPSNVNALVAFEVPEPLLEYFICDDPLQQFANRG